MREENNVFASLLRSTRKPKSPRKVELETKAPNIFGREIVLKNKITRKRVHKILEHDPY